MPIPKAEATATGACLRKFQIQAPPVPIGGNRKKAQSDTTVRTIRGKR